MSFDYLKTDKLCNFLCKFDSIKKEFNKSVVKIVELSKSIAAMSNIKSGENTDYLDQEIIRILDKNGRIPFSDIAKELNISNSLVHLRVRKMQELKIIEGFSVKLNPKEIGFETITYTGISTKEARFSYLIAEQLKSIPEVVECHWVSGKYALFIKIVARNNEELRKILYEQIHQIEGVGGTDSFISFGSAFEKNLPVK